MHKVARVAAESNASFLVFSKLPKCIHNSIYAQLKACREQILLQQSDNKDLCEEAFYCVIVWVLVNSQLTTVYFIPQVEQI